MDDKKLKAIYAIIDAIDNAIDAYSDGKLQLIIKPLIRALRALLEK